LPAQSSGSLAGSARTRLSAGSAVRAGGRTIGRLGSRVGLLLANNVVAASARLGRMSIETTTSGGWSEPSASRRSWTSAARGGPVGGRSIAHERSDGGVLAASRMNAQADAAVAGDWSRSCSLTHLSFAGAAAGLHRALSQPTIALRHTLGEGNAEDDSARPSLTTALRRLPMPTAGERWRAAAARQPRPSGVIDLPAELLIAGTRSLGLGDYLVRNRSLGLFELDHPLRKVRRKYPTPRSRL
jgi:hypothetical protein